MVCITYDTLGIHFSSTHYITIHTHTHIKLLLRQFYVMLLLPLAPVGQ